MILCRARDAYRIQTFLYGVAGLLFVAEALTFLAEGRWLHGVLLIGLQVLVVWSVRWLLRLEWRWLRAWWRGLALVLVLSATLTGCQEYVRTVAHIYGYKGDPYANPCAPESLRAGYCIPAKQEGAKP